jgi:hypothetical protein
MMTWLKRRWPALTLVTAAAACAFLWHPALRAVGMLAAADDPVAVADFRLHGAPEAELKLLLDREIGSALAAGDADLATGLVALADERGVAPAADLRARVEAAVAEQASARHLATRFALGFAKGDAEDGASLAGTLAGDLFVYGDIRDIAREGRRLAVGEKVDHLVLGLATAGLAVTAGTYVSAGGGAPLRAGLSLVKDARKMGRLSEGLAGWMGRSARGALDGAPAEKVGLVAASGGSAPAIKAAFRAEKAGALFRAAKDIGRINSSAGTRAAMEAMKLADGPKELARIARLAEAKGSRTRAVLKVLGRGGLVLGSAAFSLGSWILSFLLAAFGFASSIKAMSERAMERWLRRAKRRKARAGTDVRLGAAT